MIRNDRELQAAEQWIAYWKSTRTTGQSWIGNEQAGQKIAALRREIDEYRKARQADTAPAQAAGDPTQTPR